MHWWRISAKLALVLVGYGALSFFDRLVNPTLAPQVAHVQLADTAASTATFSAYGWAVELGWVLLVLLAIVLVVTEFLDMRFEDKKEED